VENRTVAIEFRWAEGQYNRLPTFASELVGRQVALIVANPPAVLPAKMATTTIPIVFTTSLELLATVQAGLVVSLSHPRHLEQYERRHKHYDARGLQGPNCIAAARVFSVRAPRSATLFRISPALPTASSGWQKTNNNFGPRSSNRVKPMTLQIAGEGCIVG
jgi:hypothetical protein